MSLAARALIRAIRGYQSLTRGRPSPCRYWPTCSEYAREAVALHGPLRGSVLAIFRLGRCHPYGRGGVDPVPPVFAWRCRCQNNALGRGR